MRCKRRLTWPRVFVHSRFVSCGIDKKHAGADPAENQRYIMPGFKVFRSVVPNLAPGAHISTWNHPVHSFVWDGFIIDAKVNETTDKEGNFHEGFPREDNLRFIKQARLPRRQIVLRDRNPVIFGRLLPEPLAYQRRVNRRVYAERAP